MSSKKYVFLGIDLGTGGVRCLLINEAGDILNDVSRPLKRINISKIPGHSEQDANEWIKILEQTLEELFSNSIHRDIQAVSVDSTSGTVLPVSPTGMPLGNALLHNDVRAIEEAKTCVQFFEAPAHRLSLSKILWMEENLRLLIAPFMHATDFLNCWLSGHTDLPTDSTNAMKSGLNLETGNWFDDLPKLNLPRVVPSGQQIGEISPHHCRRWG